MSLDPEERIPVISTILAVGALSNILLVLCLAHTWKYWRQVKWYVVLLTIGSFLHVGVTQAIELKYAVNYDQGSDDYSTGLCRFLTFMYGLGPSLSAMAIAALSLHCLLTTMTGSQGNWLRHALVLGLFVLLGLVLPLAKLPLLESKTYNVGPDKEVAVCVSTLDTAEAHLQLLVGESVAMVFFPLFVTLCCVLTAAVLLASSSQGSEKGDEDKSEVVLAGLFGAVLLVFCVPYYITILVIMTSPQQSAKGYEIILDTKHLMDCFSVATAIIAIGFAYVHAYRNRREFFVIPGKGPAKTGGSGERQKLVN